MTHGDYTYTMLHTISFKLQKKAKKKEETPNSRDSVFVVLGEDLNLPVSANTWMIASALHRSEPDACEED
jgi:hypothetical protein